MCDAWLTEGAGDRLVREDVLPSALGAATAATAPPPRTACGKPAQAAGRARHTFYLPKLGRKFEPFSLLSGRASGRQKVGLRGQPGKDSRDASGEEKPSLEKITGRRAPPGGC